MGASLLDDSGWTALLRRLPSGVDIDASAREAGAFVRARGVPSAQALLRLALVYGATDLSLRGTAAWAEAAGLARLSDVALLGRLRAASGWLATLASSLMTAARGSQPGGGRRIRLIDATSFGAGGAREATWRVHADYDLARSRFIGFELTGGYEPERLTRFATQPGDIVVGDRIYAHNAAALQAICDGGGDFLVRRGLTSCRLLGPDGAPLDVQALLAGVGHGRTTELRVRVPVGEDRSFAARLVIHHMPQAFAERARADAGRLAKWGAREKRLQAAEYVMLLTSLPRARLPAAELLALYRLRWQIEIAFKRLKSLVGLDQVLAKEPALARAAIGAKLIVALLTEDLLAEVLDSPPSAAEIEAIALARLQDRAGRPARRHTRPDRDPRRAHKRQSEALLQKPRRAQAEAKTAET